MERIKEVAYLVCAWMGAVSLIASISMFAACFVLSSLDRIRRRRLDRLIGPLLLIAVCTSWADAQASPDLGGIGQTVADLALSARGGTAMDLNRHVTGVLYLPYPSLRSSDGQTEYALFGIGADLGTGAIGTTLHGSPLVLPLINVVGVVSKLFGGDWSRQHLAFSNIGRNVDLGIGIKPLPIPGAGGRWVIGNQIEGIVTIGLGRKP